MLQWQAILFVQINLCTVLPAPAQRLISLLSFRYFELYPTELFGAWEEVDGIEIGMGHEVSDGL